MTLVPFAVRRLAQRNTVTILLYHRPAPDTFARHVEVLTKRYNLISLRSFVTALERGAVGELPPRSLVLTLDDGHRSNRDLIDVLRGLPAPPTVFLCSGVVGTEDPFWFDQVADPEKLKRIPDDERLHRLRAAASHDGPTGRAALAAEEIAELRRYVDFQSHTVSHPILPRCPPDRALSELRDSRAQLERRYGLQIYALAYPNGDYSERELRYARQLGYRCGLTVDFGFNGRRADPLRLRRIPINDDEDTAQMVIVKACGVWGLVRSIVRGARRARTLAASARPRRRRRPLARACRVRRRPAAGRARAR